MSIEQALTETAEQLAERVSARMAAQKADHAKRKSEAEDGIECNDFTFKRDADEIDFSGNICGMTVSGYASYSASYDHGDLSVGLFPGWDIDELEIKTIEIDFGMGLRVLDIPKDSPFAAAMLKAIESWLEGELETEEPDDGRDDD